MIPAGTEFLAVVKADAYGVGAVPLVRELERSGVHHFGVGDSSEALELRAAGCRARLLILGALVEHEIPRVVSHRIGVCLHSEGRLRSLAREAHRQARSLDVHLKVDSGMTRLGVLPSRALELARKVAASPALRLAGICTHLAGHQSVDDEGNRAQLREFRPIAEQVRDESLGQPCVHAVATATLPLARESSITGLSLMVRPGLALHGIVPAGLESARFRPLTSLRTQVVFLKDVPAGTTVGYSRAHVTDRKTRIATLPFGYNDGLPTSLHGRGEVLIRGRRAPLVGAISMDYATIDVGRVPGVEVGDPVTLVGRDGDEEITLTDFAAASGRPPYELACAIGKRVRRVYHEAASIRTAGS